MDGIWTLRSIRLSSTPQSSCSRRKIETMAGSLSSKISSHQCIESPTGFDSTLLREWVRR